MLEKQAAKKIMSRLGNVRVGNYSLWLQKNGYRLTLRFSSESKAILRLSRWFEERQRVLLEGEIDEEVSLRVIVSGARSLFFVKHEKQKH